MPVVCGQRVALAFVGASITWSVFITSRNLCSTKSSWHPVDDGGARTSAMPQSESDKVREWPGSSGSLNEHMEGAGSTTDRAVRANPSFELVPPGAKDFMAPSPVVSETWDPPVPAVQAYNWRGRKACDDWRGKMDDMLQPADWQQAIFLHSRGHTGISQVMFLQVVYLVAWMTGRPVVQFTEGPVWTILHSNYVHPSNQICNFTKFQLWDEMQTPKKHLIPVEEAYNRYDCSAWFHDLRTGDEFEVNIMEPPDSWNLPPHPLLFERIFNRYPPSKHEAWLDCRNKMVERVGTWSQKDQARAQRLTTNPRLLGRCIMRFYMGDPQPSLQTFLQPVFQILAESKAFLVGIHLRMGDKAMNKDVGHISGVDKDVRGQGADLVSYLGHVNKLVKVLRELLKPLEAEVVVFVASDSMKALKVAQELINAKVITNPGVSVHTKDLVVSDTDIVKAYADWFVLGLSGILLSPSKGTNCYDGCGSGFTKTAGDFGLPWLKVLGRDIESRDLEQLKRLPLAQLVADGIYQRKALL